MPNVSTDTIGRLMDLAREFHAQEEGTFPEEPGKPGGDWSGRALDGRHGSRLAVEAGR